MNLLRAFRSCHSFAKRTGSEKKERNDDEGNKKDKEGNRERERRSRAFGRVSRSFLRNATCSHEISSGWPSVRRQYLTDTPEIRSEEAR